MRDFVDLARLAESAGFAARSFTPIELAPRAERLEDLPPGAIIAVVFDAQSVALAVTTEMLRERIDETIPEHVRDFASWLTVAHLRCPLVDPEYPI